MNALFLQVQLGTIIATLIRELTWTLDQPFPGNDYTVRLLFACIRESLDVLTTLLSCRL